MTPLDLALQNWLYFGQHYANASHGCILGKIFLTSPIFSAQKEMKDVLRNNLMYNLCDGIRYFGCYGENSAFLLCTADEITQELYSNTLRETRNLGLS